MAENTDVTNAYCARLCQSPAWDTQLLRDSRFDRLARTLDASFAIYSGYHQVGHDQQVGLMTGIFLHVQIHHRSRSQILHNLLDLLDEHGQSASSDEMSVASPSDHDQQDNVDNNQPNSFSIRKPKRGSLSTLWLIMTLGFASPKNRILEVTIGLVMHMVTMQLRLQDQSTDSLPPLQMHTTTSYTTTTPPHPVSIPDHGLGQGCGKRTDGEGDTHSSKELTRPGSGMHQTPIATNGFPERTSADMIWCIGSV